MQVRRATATDLDQYVKLGEMFHMASPIHNVIKFDPVGYAQFYLSSLDNDNVGIWLAQIEDKIVGICGAVAYPMYFNPLATIVQELWWWLTPESRGSGAGKLMFNTIEDWAKDKNALALFMIALEDSRVKKMEHLYARSGFKPMERTFYKEVASWQ